MDWFLQARDDFRLGLERWQMWSLFAWNDVRKRYRRSVLGQFWLTLSMAITICSLGAIYSQLFHVQPAEYLPYITVTFVIWIFISTTIVDGCQAFIESEGIMRHTYVPRSAFAFRVVTRNLIVAGHNMLIIPVVFLIFGIAINTNILWLVPGTILVVLNCCWIALVLAIVCARYRDVPTIVSSAVQIAFFITPIMFTPDQIRPYASAVVEWNPFALLLEVMRDPLLGKIPTAWALGGCSLMLIVGMIFTSWLVGKYSPRVVYWL